MFARLEAFTDRFFVKFRRELPGPNVKTETQTPSQRPLLGLVAALVPWVQVGGDGGAREGRDESDPD